MYQIYCVCSKISKDTMQDQICHIFGKQILKLTARTCLEYRILLVNVTRIWSSSEIAEHQFKSLYTNKPIPIHET